MLYHKATVKNIQSKAFGEKKGFHQKWEMYQIKSNFINVSAHLTFYPKKHLRVNE